MRAAPRGFWLRQSLSLDPSPLLPRGEMHRAPRGKPSRWASRGQGSSTGGSQGRSPSRWPAGLHGASGGGGVRLGHPRGHRGFLGNMTGSGRRGWWPSSTAVLLSPRGHQLPFSSLALQGPGCTPWSRSRGTGTGGTGGGPPRSSRSRAPSPCLLGAPGALLGRAGATPGTQGAWRLLGLGSPSSRPSSRRAQASAAGGGQRRRGGS